MLPSVIDKLEDAEEADRKHYAVCTKVGSKNYNKFTLQLDGKHPVQVKNTELLGQITTFTDEKTRLEAKQIPEGKVSVDPNIAEVGEAGVALGLKTKKDVNDLNGRVQTAENKLQAEDEAKTNSRTAAVAGKNPDAWSEHVIAKDLKFEETTVKDGDDKDVTAITAVYKDADGKEVKMPLRDYVEKNAAHVAATTPQKKNKNFGFPKEEVPEGELNEFEEIRKNAEDKNKTVKTENASFTQKFFGTGAP